LAQNLVGAHRQVEVRKQEEEVDRSSKLKSTRGKSHGLKGKETPEKVEWEKKGKQEGSRRETKSASKLVVEKFRVNMGRNGKCFGGRVEQKSL